MKKPYESHEIAYQKMRQQGIKQWGGKGSGTKGSFSYETKRFLKDVLSQPWAPKAGKAVEFGCGTGPIIRWVCERGFTGLGFLISKTAIAMAKELKRRGFSFVGPTTAYAFMQAMGIVNDHLADCATYEQVEAARAGFVRPGAKRRPRTRECPPHRTRRAPDESGSRR